jgi:hypothetical protein
MLTLHQREVLTDGLNLLLRFNKLVLKGSAGVGKTFGADYLEMMLTERFGPQPTYISAPTHKALSILRRKIDIEGRKHITFITAHSALKLKRSIHRRTGKISFKPNFSPNYPPLKGVKRFFIDESSMLNTELINYIERYAEKDCLIVFLGDDKQINPVGELDSPVFKRNYPEVELTEIIRQGLGNPIIDLSRNLNWISRKSSNLVEGEDDKYIGYSHTQDRERIIKALAEANGTDALKYLAWTNKEVDNINFFVRKEIYKNPKKVELGESLIFNTPYASQFFTNEEIIVKELEILTHKFRVFTGYKGYEDFDIKLYCINVSEKTKVNEKAPFGILVVHEDSETTIKALEYRLKKLCKDRIIEWVEYYTFIEQFADLKYNHALTVHKSQGSTFTKTIVNVGDIRRNRTKEEKQRLLYTAVTRAAEVLVLYNT